MKKYSRKKHPKIITWASLFLIFAILGTFSTTMGKYVRNFEAGTFSLTVEKEEETEPYLEVDLTSYPTSFNMIPGLSATCTCTVTATYNVDAYVFLVINDHRQGAVTWTIDSSWTLLSKETYDDPRYGNDPNGDRYLWVYYQTVSYNSAGNNEDGYNVDDLNVLNPKMLYFPASWGNEDSQAVTEHALAGYGGGGWDWWAEIISSDGFTSASEAWSALNSSEEAISLAGLDLDDKSDTAWVSAASVVTTNVLETGKIEETEGDAADDELNEDLTETETEGTSGGSTATGEAEETEIPTETETVTGSVEETETPAETETVTGSTEETEIPTETETAIESTEGMETDSEGSDIQ